MSAAMFSEFCRPELLELSQTFGGLGRHCCAHAQRQFAGFRRIPGFYAFNRVATGVGWEGDNALEELGGPVGPVMVPGWVSPECVRTLLRKAPAGTRFIFNGTAFDRADDAARWLVAVRQAAAEQ